MFLGLVLYFHFGQVADSDSLLSRDATPSQQIMCDSSEPIIVDALVPKAESPRSRCLHSRLPQTLLLLVHTYLQQNAPLRCTFALQPRLQLHRHEPWRI